MVMEKQGPNDSKVTQKCLGCPTLKALDVLSDMVQIIERIIDHCAECQSKEGSIKDG